MVVAAMLHLLGAAAMTASPAPITINDLLAVTDISSLAPSPDGTLLAFRLERPSLAADQIVTEWWVVPSDGRSPARRIADGGPASYTDAGLVAAEAPVWTRDGRALLFRVMTNGRRQVWRADVTKTAPTQITRSDGDVVAFAVGAEADSIVYTAAPSLAATRREEARLRAEGAHVDAALDLSIGVTGGAPSADGEHSVRLTGDWYDRRDLLADRPRFFQQTGAGRAVAISSGPAFSAFAKQDGEAIKSLCEKRDCNASRPSWTTPLATGRVLVALADHAKRQTLAIWNGRTLRIVRRGTGLLSGSRVHVQPCAVSGDYAFCVAAEASTPPRLVRVDLRSGAQTLLAAPNAALAARTEGSARVIEWRDSSGRRFTGQYIAPRGPAPATGFPLVLQYYLCEGFLRGGQGDELPFYPLAAHGVATLCVNGYADRNAPVDRIAEYRIAQSGLEAVVDLLSARKEIDRRRIGMQGLSFGSEVTMWMTRRSSLLKAAAIATGQIEPSGYWLHAAPETSFAKMQSQTWKIGSPDVGPEAWRDASPARDADRIRIPLLMQLPESEARWSIELIGRLRTTGKPVDLFVYPAAPHIKSRPQQKRAAYERNLAWFTHWLTGVELADPADPNRSARWRALGDRGNP